MSVHTHSLRLFFVLAALVALASSPASSDDYVQYRGHFDPQFFAELLDVETHGDTVYVSGVGGFSVVDITYPTTPQLVGRYDPPGSPYVRFYQSTVGDGFAYCAARFDGIFILDITTPSSPILEYQHLESDVAFEGVTLVDTLLFVSAREHGIRIFSAADPDTLVQVGMLEELSATWRLSVDPPYAYAADGAGGIKVIDISDPTSPALAGSLITSSAAQDIDVENGTAYLAVGSSGMDVVDISSPTDPGMLSNFDTPGSTIGIAVEESLAFLADWEGVKVVDVMDPEQPVLAGWEDTPVRAMGIDAAGTTHYVADWSTFRIYDYGPTSDPDIHLPVTEINLGEVEVGEGADTAALIVNTGGVIVKVTNITSSNPDFDVSPMMMDISPSDTTLLQIDFFRSFESSTSSTISIFSDDPDEPFRRLLVEITDNHNLQEGEPAPDFTLNDLEGLPHTLSDYRGQVVLLAFFASW